MLSDRERETLRDLQRRLVSEDPEFARSFDVVGERDSTWSVQWVLALPGWTYAAVTTVAAMIGLGLLVVGAPWTALAFAVLSSLAWAAWRRRDDRTDQP